MTLDDIRPYLKNAKPRQDGYTAACPVCGDDHHLYVSYVGGKLLMYCQKCDAKYPDIIKAFGIKAEKRLIENYDHIYRNPDGSIAYYKTRKKFDDGSKQFSFWHHGDTGRVNRKPDNAPNLYNLDLLEHADPSTRLYIVEGEKCADVCTKAGLLATTSNAGGGNRKLTLSADDARLLDKFTDKVIMPDNDETGEKYIGNFPNAKVLRLSEIWPLCPKKGDIANYIDAGNPIDAIVNYVFPEPTAETDAAPDAVPADAETVSQYATITKQDISDKKLYEYLLSLPSDKREWEKSRISMLASELKCVNDFNRLYKYACAQNAKEGDYHGNVTQFTGQPLELPCGKWIADDTGVYEMAVNNFGQMERREVSKNPVMPVEILRNVSTGTERLRIACRNDGVWRNFVVDRVTAASSSRVVELANRGVETNSENSKRLVRYITDCIGGVPVTNAVSSLGWLDDHKGFAPYEKSISFDGEQEYASLYAAFREKGSFDDWCAMARKLRENTLLRMTMAASFASVLIEPTHGLPFVYHLWGGTGAGKTVALMVAMSVWGDPSIGKTVRTMNMTTNSMLSTSAFLRHMPFAGDELQTIKSRYENYDTTIMRLTEGIDRGRMSYDKVNQTKTWKCSFLFSGEEPCTKPTSGGGVYNRVIECECDGAIVADGQNAVRTISGNHGHAGRKYVEFVQRCIPDLGSAASAFQSAIKAETDTTDKQAISMALMLLADKLAGACLFPGEAPLTVKAVAPYLKTNQDVDIASRAYDYAVNLVSRNITRFARARVDDEDAVFDGVGEAWGRIDGNIVTINTDVLMSKLAEVDIDFNAVKASLARKGLLVLTRQRKYVHWASYTGIKANCFKLKLMD